MDAQTQFSLLEREYPNSTYYLHFDTPFHLVIATILSAQTRDTVVNAITPKLYAKYKTPDDVLRVSETELAEDIKSITYYQAKARYIIQACQTLKETCNNQVPKEINELTQLAGVGKKTANAIQQNAFDKLNGVVVDTHVIRLAQRLGWSDQKNPDKIEKKLMELFPQEKWKSIPHILKNHGQQVCTARAPTCAACVLKESCPSAFTF